MGKQQQMMQISKRVYSCGICSVCIRERERERERERLYVRATQKGYIRTSKARKRRNNRVG